MFLKLQSCVWTYVFGLMLFQACRPEDPFAGCYVPPAEVAVLGSQLFASSVREHGGRDFAGVIDSLAINQVERHFFRFTLNFRSFQNMVYSPAKKSFWLINEAYACSPAFQMYTRQAAKYFRVVSDMDFGADYPAGSDLSNLFVQADFQQRPNGMTLAEFFTKNGLNGLLNGGGSREFMFIGSAPAGSTTRFIWELQLEKASFEATSPIILF